MRRLLVVSLALSWSVVAIGEDLLSCVADEVQDGLLFWRPGQVRTSISSDMPPEFARIPVPPQVEWIGHAEFQMDSAAAFRAGDDLSAVWEQAAAALVADGWELDTRSPDMALLGSGNRSRPFCRDDEVLTLAAIERTNTNYLLYRRRAVSPGLLACRPVSRGLPLAEHMPVFNFAEIDPNARRVGGTGSGGHDHSVQSVRIVTNVEHDALSAYVSGQFETQGWTNDTSWSGIVGTGSTWTRPAADGVELSASLDVFSMGGSTYEIIVTIGEFHMDGAR